LSLRLALDISFPGSFGAQQLLQEIKLVLLAGEPRTAFRAYIGDCREFQRKATKEEFERSRREYPAALSDKLAHEKFDFLPVTIHLEARFKNLELNYLFGSATSQSDD
jgi:hypothetical protein